MFEKIKFQLLQLNFFFNNNLLVNHNFYILILKFIKFKNICIY